MLLSAYYRSLDIHKQVTSVTDQWHVQEYHYVLYANLRSFYLLLAASNPTTVQFYRLRVVAVVPLYRLQSVGYLRR